VQIDSFKKESLKLDVNLLFVNFLEPVAPITTTQPTVTLTKKDNKGQSSFLPMIVAAIGGCALLFLFFILIFIAMKKRRDMVNDQREGNLMLELKLKLSHKLMLIFRTRKQIKSKSHSSGHCNEW
jgi:Na+/melibiose symporter-like transporter